jgi:tripartite-type tricarboxylate transporter receptor subunit TctC
VRVVVGFAAGGPQDIVGRLVAQWLSERLGQQFVVENRTGASGNIAAETVIRAPSDGYTLLVVGLSNAANAALYEKLNFNFIRDVTPIAGIIRTPLIMEVAPSFPMSSVPELIAYAKANPGKVNMASAGVGAPNHLAGELFKVMTGVNILDVPYRGSGPAMADLFGGQVQMMFDPLPGSIEHVKAGKLRALAVTTSARSDALPMTPTLATFVPGYEVSTWYGVAAPRNTSTEIVEKLNRAINAGLADPRLQARLAALGGMLLAGSPDDFGRLLADETDKWAKLIRTANIKAE